MGSVPGIAPARMASDAVRELAERPALLPGLHAGWCLGVTAEAGGGAGAVGVTRLAGGLTLIVVVTTPHRRRHQGAGRVGMLSYRSRTRLA